MSTKMFPRVPTKFDPHLRNRSNHFETLTFLRAGSVRSTWLVLYGHLGGRLSHGSHAQALLRLVFLGDMPSLPQRAKDNRAPWVCQNILSWTPTLLAFVAVPLQTKQPEKASLKKRAHKSTSLWNTPAVFWWLIAPFFAGTWIGQFPRVLSHLCAE